jgi:hypothetical protein
LAVNLNFDPADECRTERKIVQSGIFLFFRFHPLFAKSAIKTDDVTLGCTTTHLKSVKTESDAMKCVGTFPAVPVVAPRKAVK